MSFAPSVRRLVRVVAFLLAVAALAVSTSFAAAPFGRGPVLAIVDYSQRVDANDLSMMTSNVGSFGFDANTGSSGLEYPRGSGKTLLFAGGVWVGALVSGVPHVTVAEYSMEFAPGTAAGGVPSDPNDARFKVYKLLRDYASTSERDDALADYIAGAVPDGAPVIAPLGPTGLAIRGDQMTWTVCNDLDPSTHQNAAGSTAPLGLELRTTFNAWANSGPLSRAILGKLELHSVSNQALDATRIGLWLDPDLGGANDDLVGCVPDSALGYCYNATNADLMYGSAPPALGIRILKITSSGGPISSLSAFIKYINGTDPHSAVESYRQLSGLAADGSAIVNPVSGLPTTFMVDGDPTIGTGWLDSAPSDRRMLLAAGPMTLAPGQTVTIDFVILVGQGTDRLSSVTALKQLSSDVVTAFDSPTAVLASVVESRMAPDGAHLAWQLGGDRVAAVRLERTLASVAEEVPPSSWESIATLNPDGDDRVEFVDRSVEPGHRYGYRLRSQSPIGGEAVGVTWLDVSRRPEFSLHAVSALPSAGRVTFAIELPESEPASLEVFDVNGRRIERTPIDAGDSGRATVMLGATRELPVGVLFARLKQGARRTVVSFAVMR